MHVDLLRVLCLLPNLNLKRNTALADDGTNKNVESCGSTHAEAFAKCIETVFQTNPSISPRRKLSCRGKSNENIRTDFETHVKSGLTGTNNKFKSFVSE